MADPHANLREDIHLLGELLGDTLRQYEGHALLERVERVRAMAKDARSGGTANLQGLADALGELPIDAAIPVARAFAHFLALANIAEQHHRMRRRRDYARLPNPRPQPGSCAEAFPRLIAAGVSPAALANAVGSLRIEVVFTAHPTEVVRRTLLQAYNRIAAILASRDRGDLTPAERDELIDQLRREIATAWQTHETRDRPVAPLDEVRAGLVVFEETLWEAVPTFLRELDRALYATTGCRLPIDATPVQFGSWIGGDRDGNSNVTPAITHQATWLMRWQAAALYLRDIQALRAELSLTTATDELRGRTAGAREPYRALLRDVRDRLVATREHAAASLSRPLGAGWSIDAERLEPRAEGRAHDPLRAGNHRSRGATPYLWATELAEPLQLCYRSLLDTGNELIATGTLLDVLRRVATFGLTLARLDIRQEAARHTEAVDWLFRSRHLGEYRTASEPERQRLLTHSLTHRRMVIDEWPIAEAPETVRDVIDTFRIAASLNPESLGAYVITMASRPSDVLAVEFLQTLAGTAHPQRVVPLFETTDDLSRAGDVLRALFANTWYEQRIGRRQEVMVGYSDSAKEAGRFSAAWSLYRAQEEIVAACGEYGVHLTLFHGRGGSVGRGGGPTCLALQSQPPGSVNGTFRVTEQGETIQAKFGLHDIALRTCEVYTTATLEALLAPSAAPRPEWRACMDRLYEEGRAAYRDVVYSDPEFLAYFRSATPEPELRTIHVGSRPARRASGDGLEGLRAIPWQFAWTQTRLLLASWLGVESALRGASARGEDAILREMYDGWAFFRSTIDLIEMVLAKADAQIAELYDRQLVSQELQPLGHRLRARLFQAVDAVLGVARHDQLVQNNPVLRRSIGVRNPYVDPINLVQIELLRRLRASGDDDARLHRAFVVTVNGIAAGMRNTG